MIKTITLQDGTILPAIGEGTWYLGESSLTFQSEKASLTAGIRAGMKLIDTAEMYGDGQAEILVGECIQDFPRDDVFLVSKYYPNNASRARIFRTCEASLKRMRTDHLDLYLLHWRGSVPLAETAACMEELKKQGKILRWGVSNFDASDMEELWNTPQGRGCCVNQVLYHLGSRGVEYDLLPWMKEHGVAMMAYCPLAQGGSLKRSLYSDPVLRRIAAAHQATVSQILLAFVIAGGGVIAIPRTAHAEHAQENAAALSLTLTQEELAQLDQAWPAPRHKTPLDMQ